MAKTQQPKFRTQYDGIRVRIRCCPGSPVIDARSARVVDSHICLQPSGKRNLYDEIQSHRYEGDLKAMIARFQVGDQSVLAATQGYYGDYDGLPTTYAEMAKVVEESKMRFERLPVTIREAYHHNYREYIADLGTDHCRDVFLAAGRSASSQSADKPAESEAANA